MGTNIQHPQNPPDDGNGTSHLKVELSPKLVGNKVEVEYRIDRSDKVDVSTYAIGIDSDGNLIFAGQKGKVRIEFKIVENGWSWDSPDEIRYIKFAHSENDPIEYVNTDKDKTFFSEIKLKNGDKNTLVMVYHNKRRKGGLGTPHSWNSIYKYGLKYMGRPYEVDPIISNGGNPSDDSQLGDPP